MNIKTFEKVLSVLGGVLAYLLELGCYRNNELGPLLGPRSTTWEGGGGTPQPSSYVTLHLLHFWVRHPLHNNSG